jgi:stringent starvation protein B
MSAVIGVFAKETGYGFAFATARDPVASLAAATAPDTDIGGAPERDARKPDAAKQRGKAKARPSHLQIIK